MANITCLEYKQRYCWLQTLKRMKWSKSYLSVDWVLDFADWQTE